MSDRAHPHRSPELQALLDEVEQAMAREAAAPGAADRPADPPSTTEPPSAEPTSTGGSPDAGAGLAPTGTTEPVALPTRSARRSRRALLLAGSAAAAVVAIVAVSDRGTPGDNHPATVPKPGVGVAVIGSTGPDGRTTRVTTTAPTTTSGNRLIVLVTGADGSTSTVPALTSAPSTHSPTPGGHVSSTPGTPVSRNGHRPSITVQHRSVPPTPDGTTAGTGRSGPAGAVTGTIMSRTAGSTGSLRPGSPPAGTRTVPGGPTRSATTTPTTPTVSGPTLTTEPTLTTGSETAPSSDPSVSSDTTTAPTSDPGAVTDEPATTTTDATRAQPTCVGLSLPVVGDLPQPLGCRGHRHRH
ncbi:hypothetical protein SAMN04515671_1222 [Nakamurella panacisegetis]|uniref:Uncharacterized protein n=1 Tax=Nakamurella panacisegetis TaxID=1090615 RepID=A0A1H0K9Q3_9ACTN|nr:hypothetical protein [Nakamurella panacisegetis]SDO52624.1 hypothetical protein SAMN04515671_1222 [Nakamurella panacisegetis]